MSSEMLLFPQNILPGKTSVYLCFKFMCFERRVFCLSVEQMLSVAAWVWFVVIKSPSCHSNPQYFIQSWETDQIWICYSLNNISLCPMRGQNIQVLNDMMKVSYFWTHCLFKSFEKSIFFSSFFLGAKK